MGPFFGVAASVLPGQPQESQGCSPRSSISGQGADDDRGPIERHKAGGG